MLNQQYKDKYPNSIIKYTEDDKDIVFELITNDNEQNNVFKQNLSDMQIIYTTHSPYMIDAEDLYSLRVIHKDDETRIFNTTLEYLDYRKNTKKRKDVDVLSPVLIATGINVSNQLIIENYFMVKNILILMKKLKGILNIFLKS